MGSPWSAGKLTLQNERRGGQNHTLEKEFPMFHARHCPRLSVGLVVAVCVLVAPLTRVSAQSGPRMAVFALNCVGTPYGHTKASVRGTLTFQSKTVAFAASCEDGPSPSVWPTLDYSYGKLLGMSAPVTVQLTDRQQQVVGTTTCTFTAKNTFVSGHCMAVPALAAGEVQLLISMAP
jgi:hypothetical protein